MAIHKTTNYGLDKPEKGTLNWHENLNQNFDKIDTELKNQRDKDNILENRIDIATQLIWKTPVANFTSISSTYTNPSSAWAVQTLDDGKIYRYNGTEWIYIANGNIVPNTHYLWAEEKTITKGSNSFTLTNEVGVGNKLLIIDKKYGVEWFEILHWTRDGQIITLTESSLGEDLTFRVINFG